MRAILVFNAADGMKGRNILFACQETHQVCSKGLAVALEFGVGRIARNVIHQVAGNVFLGTKGQAGRKRIRQLGIHKASLF